MLILQLKQRILCIGVESVLSMYCPSLVSSISIYLRVQKNPFFKSSPTQWVFCILLGFGLYWVFRICLFEQAVWKLVGCFSSSAKLLFTFTSTLDYLKICKFITYWSLEAVNIRMKSLIITGTTNWNWLKCGAGFMLGFSMGLPKNDLVYPKITWVCEPWHYIYGISLMLGHSVILVQYDILWSSYWYLRVLISLGAVTSVLYNQSVNVSCRVCCLFYVCDTSLFFCLFVIHGCTVRR